MVTRDLDQSSWAASLRCIQLDRVLFLATSHLTLQSFNHLQRRTMRVFYRGRISEFDVKNYGYNCMRRFLIFVANYDNTYVPLPRLTFQPILAIIANNSSNFVPNCLYRLNWLIWSKHSRVKSVKLIFSVGDDLLSRIFVQQLQQFCNQSVLKPGRRQGGSDC